MPHVGREQWRWGTVQQFLMITEISQCVSRIQARFVKSTPDWLGSSPFSKDVDNQIMIKEMCLN